MRNLNELLSSGILRNDIPSIDSPSSGTSPSRSPSPRSTPARSGSNTSLATPPGSPARSGSDTSLAHTPPRPHEPAGIDDLRHLSCTDRRSPKLPLKTFCGEPVARKNKKVALDMLKMLTPNSQPELEATTEIRALEKTERITSTFFQIKRGPQALVQVSHKMSGGRSNAYGVALCLFFAARPGYGKPSLDIFKQSLLDAYKRI